MYQRNKENKLVFRPDMLKKGGKGIYILTETDEEITTCIKNLQRLNIPWRSGVRKGIPQFIKDRMPTFARIEECKKLHTPKSTGVVRVEDLKYIAIGNHDGFFDLPHCFGYTAFVDFKDEPTDFLQTPRILFKNVIWDFTLALPKPGKPSYEVETI